MVKQERKVSQEHIDYAIAEAKNTKKGVRYYPHGFVPNSYYYGIYAERVVAKPDGSFQVESYDMKRSHGYGKSLVVIR